MGRIVGKSKSNGSFGVVEQPDMTALDGAKIWNSLKL